MESLNHSFKNFKQIFIFQTLKVKTKTKIFLLKFHRSIIAVTFSYHPLLWHGDPFQFAFLSKLYFIIFISDKSCVFKDEMPRVKKKEKTIVHELRNIYFVDFFSKIANVLFIIEFPDFESPRLCTIVRYKRRKWCFKGWTLHNECKWLHFKRI